MRNPQAGLLLFVLTALIGCDDRVVGWPIDEAVPPTVLATVPTDGAVDVDPETTVLVFFSEPMDPASVTTTTFTVSDGTTALSGQVRLVGVTATFVPDGPLAPGVVYTGRVTRDVADVVGNTLVADHVWTFTTRSARDRTPPRVISTAPSRGATGVGINAVVSAIFSEPMDTRTLTSTSFTVKRLGVAVDGDVSHANDSATFRPRRPLPANTTFTATVTTAARDLDGNAMLSDHVWEFRTGGTLDTTRPSVISTRPRDDEDGVALDTRVLVTFDEAMNPLSLTPLTFTLRSGDVLVPGGVATRGNSATFAPDVALEPNTSYTATVTSGATDLAGNQLAANHVWTFTTGALVDGEDPTVTLTSPDDLATDVPLDTSVNATFSEPMSPTSITTSTFVVTDPEGAELEGSVGYDSLTDIATFTPSEELAPDTTYTVTITTETTDLAGNPLSEDEVWTFTTGAAATGVGQGIDLRSLSSFVAVAGAGLTNSNSSGPTVLNGDVGLSPTASCIGDGSPCTITNPIINGTLYANDPAGIAAQAKTDLTAAFVEAMARPVGTTVNDLSGLVLAPGVYTSDSTMSVAVGGTVTLDGQGDSNAVWIFQIGSSLTVNNDAKVLLINGAKAKNVFWAIAASSTLGSNVSFVGSVLAGSSNSVGTDSVVIGRLLCTTGAISLLSNTITLPPL